MNVGESYDGEDGKKYTCLHGSDGSVRLEYSTAGHTQEITFCLNGEKPVKENEACENEGASFKCVKKDDHYEFEWQKGGACKLKDNSVLNVNEEKREGDINYRCEAVGLRIVVVVKGKRTTTENCCSF
jgi:hypothetical protein